MFTEEVVNEISAQAIRIGVEAAALLAVAEVESGGRAFVAVSGRSEPLIRFEGHYFDRRLTPEQRASARAAGLSSPVAGGIRNPNSQAGRWRLLERAANIDRKAAWESVSWGIGQVMGAHWAWLGYKSVDALVEEARSGVGGQARLMTAFIDRAGLVDALRRRDWAAFARGYNGPQYRRHRYDEKVRAAYERWSMRVARPPIETPQRPVLRNGSRGAAVRVLQMDLTALGYPLQGDGVFGPATAKALRQFQSDQGLSVDGIAGGGTYAAIQEVLRTPSGSGLFSYLRGSLARVVGIWKWCWRDRGGETG